MADSKTTIYLDPNDYRRLKALARAQGRPAAQLIREAVAEYTRRHGAPPKPGSIGSGRSKSRNVAARAEELLDDMGRDE